MRNFAERNAKNAPIQGSAADIIKIAMVRIFERFRREEIKSKMILQVHDELNFSVLPEEKERVEKIVLEEMQNAYPLRVPLVADSGWERIGWKPTKTAKIQLYHSLLKRCLTLGNNTAIMILCHHKGQYIRFLH